MKTKVLILICILHNCVFAKDPETGIQNLYDNGASNGIQSFEKEELANTLNHTSKPWLVHFYASWCSHCQRYAPKFKKFGIMVEGWNDIIGVGVINCAQEHNIDTCRRYEIEGYPSLKLFSPHKPFPQNGLWMKPQEPNLLVNVLTDWIETFQHNKVSQMLKTAPDLTSFTATNPIEIWKSENERLQNANSALLLFCNDTHDYMVNRLILDHYHLTESNDKQTIVRKVLVDGNTLNGNNTKSPSNTIKLARSIGIRNQTTLPLVVALERKDLTSQSQSQNCNSEVLNVDSDKLVYKDILNKLVTYSFNSSTATFDSQKLLSYKCDADDIKDDLIFKPLPLIEKVKDKQLIEKRRYKVFMNDIEKAIAYSLGHEVAEKRIIEGKALVALENYLEVLSRLFPTKHREKTSKFLNELYTWTRKQKNSIKGEDFKAKVTELTGKHSAFSDLGDYIGCKGSDSKYGQYPCAVWSLWHVLTVRQIESDTSFRSADWVLMTMVDYIRYFFGCRHCAEHFLKVAEDGRAVQHEVKNVEDSILWLWRAHNLANLRLKDDIATNDPAYPKEVFPSKTFCSRCFQSASEVNTNTLSIDNKVYILQEVLHFLRQTYGNISMDNLRKSEVNVNDTTKNVENQMVPLTTDDLEAPFTTEDLVAPFTTEDLETPFSPEDLEALKQINKTIATNEPTETRQFIFIEMDVRVLYGIIIIVILLFLRSIIKKKGGCLMFMLNTHQAYKGRQQFGARTKPAKFGV